MPRSCTASLPPSLRCSLVSDPSSAVQFVADREICIGSGMCVMYAPSTFGQDASAKVIVLAGDADADGDPADTIRTAIEACPTGALTLVDSEGE